MEFKKILSVGCSNTVGVNLEEEIGIFDYLRKDYDDMDLGKQVREYRMQNNFSTLISNHFNSECINLGVSGASNERIIFSMIDYLENHDDVDFVLVNLSGQARLTFEYYERLFDLDLSYTTEHLYEQAKIDKDGFKEFIDFHKDYLFGKYVTHSKQKNLYKYLSLYLKDKGIPHLITQTIPTDFELEKFTNKCIDINFDEFNESEGRKRARGNHWLSDSHVAWSKLLIDKIKELYGN